MNALYMLRKVSYAVAIHFWKDGDGSNMDIHAKAGSNIRRGCTDQLDHDRQRRARFVRNVRGSLGIIPAERMRLVYARILDVKRQRIEPYVMFWCCAQASHEWLVLDSLRDTLLPRAQRGYLLTRLTLDPGYSRPSDYHPYFMIHPRMHFSMKRQSLRTPRLSYKA
jgi:hypothetical protein